MVGSLFSLFGAVAVFFVAAAFGWTTPSLETRAHARVHPHAAEHAHRLPHGVIIDDDDAYDEDDEASPGILVPQRGEMDEDATATLSDPLRDVVSTEATSVQPPRAGLRPAGEHRDTTDRPPRA